MLIFEFLKCVEVKGFPTIIFYPAGKDAKPITFDGGDRRPKVGVWSSDTSHAVSSGDIAVSGWF
jgi:hypothetical protein